MQTHLRPLKDKIFVDITDRGQDLKTINGIIIPGDDFNHERGIRPREAKVLAIGPEVKDVRVGDRILLGHGDWTRKVKFDGQEGWMTEEGRVLLVLE